MVLSWRFQQYRHSSSWWSHVEPKSSTSLRNQIMEQLPVLARDCAEGHVQLQKTNGTLDWAGTLAVLGTPEKQCHITRLVLVFQSGSGINCCSQPESPDVSVTQLWTDPVLDLTVSQLIPNVLTSTDYWLTSVNHWSLTQFQPAWELLSPISEEPEGSVLFHSSWQTWLRVL